MNTVRAIMVTTRVRSKAEIMQELLITQQLYWYLLGMKLNVLQSQSDMLLPFRGSFKNA